MGNKISIIVPVYKVEKYLDKCIESIVNQTYTNLEIILVDDGSPDNCPKMCDEWAKKDNRIKVIHKENAGVSEARNSGLDIATGDYIGFVDSDDFIEPNMYEKLVQKLNETKGNLAMCSYKNIYEDGSEKICEEKNLNNVNSESIFKYLFITQTEEKKDRVITYGVMGAIWRILAKKELINNLRFQKFVIAEDLLYLMNLIKENTIISVVNEPLYCYLIRKDSAMHAFNENKIEQKFRVFKEILKILIGKGNEDIVKAFKFYNYASLTHEMLKNGRLTLLKQYLKDEFFLSLNSKENYKSQMRNTKSFKRKVGYFLIHKKWFKIYMVLLKFI